MLTEIFNTVQSFDGYLIALINCFIELEIVQWVARVLVKIPNLRFALFDFVLPGDNGAIIHLVRRHVDQVSECYFRIIYNQVEIFMLYNKCQCRSLHKFKKNPFSWSRLKLLFWARVDVSLELLVSNYF